MSMTQIWWKYASMIALAALVFSGIVNPSDPVQAVEIGETQMVSVGSMGSANRYADGATVSADGRFVAFNSDATNLTSVSNNGYPQVYVRDTLAGTIRLVSSTGNDPDRAADAPAVDQAISADGRFVAFVSRAHNLESVVKDANSGPQIFVRDLNPGGSTWVVSAPPARNDGGNSASGRPVISADGRKIVFESYSTDLVPGVAPTANQIYEADLVIGGGPTNTALVSRRDSGLPAPTFANDYSRWGSVSADGSVVAFASKASNLVGPTGPPGVSQVYLHSMIDGTTKLVSGPAGGTIFADAYTDQPSVSADGTKVAFYSNATNLATIPTGSHRNVYIRNMATGQNAEVVNVDSTGTHGCGQGAVSISLSGDGRFAVFKSGCTDLAPVVSGGLEQVWVRDLRAGHTFLVSSIRADHTVGITGGSVNAPTISNDGSAVAWDAGAVGLADVEDLSGQQVYVRGVNRNHVDRIGGADRYAVSAATSADRFAPGAEVAYVASGEVFPDALSGSAAAGLQHGPVLLVARDSVPQVIQDELMRLKPKKIVILGGTASVSNAVQRILGGLGSTVVRVAGVDRFEVSAAVSASTFQTGAPVAFVASGAVYADALSGSAAAGTFDAPVLLVSKDQVPGVVADEIDRLRPAKIVVLGGANSVSDTVLESLRAKVTDTVRIAGSDRYDVSAAVSASYFPDRVDTVFVASGEAFPDALSGSASAISNGSPVLLVTKNDIPASVAVELERLDPTRIVVLGGANTIDESVAANLTAYLTP